MIENEYAYIKEGVVCRKSFRNFPERSIGEVKTDEPAAFAYFEDRFRLAENKVLEIESAVESAENKGSYLMKLIHLKEYLINIDAIGDFESLFIRLERLEVLLNRLIAENRASNLLIKRELIEEATKLKGSTDWKDDTDKFKELKAQWIKTGNVEKEYQEEINHQFSKIVDDFFSRRQFYFQKKHQLVQGKISQLKSILYKAKSASRKTETVAKAELKALQEEWKNVGKVPGNLSRSLYQEFRKISNNIFKNEAPDTGGRSIEDIVKEKEGMVKEVQKIVSSSAPSQADVEKIKSLQQLWKQMGQLPREQNKFMAASFYTACNLATEKFFVNNIVESKYNNWSELSEKEQLKIKLQVVKDLLSRDENELETFQENLEKVNTGTNNGTRLISSQFTQQERKVRIKKMLLDELNKELKNK